MLFHVLYLMAIVFPFIIHIEFHIWFDEVLARLETNFLQLSFLASFMILLARTPLIEFDKIFS